VTRLADLLEQNKLEGGDSQAGGGEETREKGNVVRGSLLTVAVPEQSGGAGLVGGGGGEKRSWELEPLCMVAHPRETKPNLGGS